MRYLCFLLLAGCGSMPERVYIPPIQPIPYPPNYAAPRPATPQNVVCTTVAPGQVICQQQ